MFNQTNRPNLSRNLLRIVFAACVPLLLMPASQAQSPQRAKLGYALPEDHPQGLAAKYFAELIAKGSNGRILVQTFSDSKLGDDRAMIGAMQGGIQELSIQSTSPFVGTIKEFGLLDLPFIFASEKQADSVLDGAVGKKLLELMQSKGLVGLSYLENGFRQMTNSRRPINTADDIKGLKIRVMQSPVFIDTMKSLGANPTPLAFAELFVALETRTVDGQENPLAIIDSAKFYEVQKYLSVTNHAYNAFVLSASKAWFDKLSPADQAMVRNAALKTRDYQRKLNRERNAKYLVDLQKRGMVVNSVSPAELEKMAVAVRPVRDKFAAQYDAALAQKFFAALDAAAP